ncbi:SNX19 [Branchiostoma lanceolatum]|uniref:SNX19 protein n=1 Tax=Branchiostoma lanceolatum TaxID=7740 RepID=A0A8J9Z713_BRALA|nr:SNX19 [Branchiostoma lanceolatum]
MIPASKDLDFRVHTCFRLGSCFSGPRRLKMPTSQGEWMLGRLRKIQGLFRIWWEQFLSLKITQKIAGVGVGVLLLAKIVGYSSYLLAYFVLLACGIWLGNYLTSHDKLLKSDILLELSETFLSKPNATSGQDSDDDPANSQDPLNRQLESLTRNIMRDFVMTWYTDITGDPQFSDEAFESLEDMSLTLSTRFKELDQHVLVEKVLKAVHRHLFTTKEARKLLKTQPNFFKSDLDSESSLLAAYEKVAKIHIALQCQAVELDYLRNIAEVLLYVVFPVSTFRCESGKELVREILTCQLILPVVNMVSDPDWLNQKIFQILSPSEAVLEQSFDENLTKTLAMTAGSVEDMRVQSSRSRDLPQVDKREPKERAEETTLHSAKSSAKVFVEKESVAVGMNVVDESRSNDSGNTKEKDQQSELLPVTLAKGDLHVTTEQVREEPIGGTGSPGNVSPLSTSLEGLSNSKPKAVLSGSLSSSESSLKHTFLPDIVMVKDSDGPENQEDTQTQEEDTQAQEHLKKPGIGRRASALLMKKLGLGSKKEEGQSKNEDEKSRSDVTVAQKPTGDAPAASSEETPQTSIVDLDQLQSHFRLAPSKSPRTELQDSHPRPTFVRSSSQDSFVSIPEDENELYSPFEQVTMEEVVASIARRSTASDSQVHGESASDELTALPIHRTKSNSESKLDNEDGTIRTVSQPISISAPSTKLPRSATSPGLLSNSPNRSPLSNSPNLNQFRLSPSKERERQMKRSLSSSPGSERAAFPQADIRVSTENIPEVSGRRDEGKDEVDGASHHGKENHLSSKLFHNVRIPKTQTAVEYKGMGTRKYTLYRVQYETTIMVPTEGEPGQEVYEPITTTMSVRRRFREFITLHVALEENPKYRKIMKNVKGPNRLFYLPFGNMDKNTIRQRRGQLQDFLGELCSKPEVCQSKELQEFLAYGRDGSIAFVRKPPDIIPRFDKLFTNAVSDLFDTVKSALPSTKSHDQEGDTKSNSKSEGAKSRSTAGTTVESDSGIKRNQAFVDSTMSDHLSVETTLQMFIVENDRENEALLRDDEGRSRGAGEEPLLLLGPRSQGDGCDMTDMGTEIQHTGPVEEPLPLADRTLLIGCEALEGQRSWFCEDRVQQVVRTAGGRLLEQWLHSQVTLLTNQEQCVYYLSLLREAVWPGGILPDEPEPIRTEEEKEESKQQALEAMVNFLPGLFPLLLGQLQYQTAMQEALEAFQHPRINRHVAYCLLDLLVEAVVPEVDTAELQRNLLLSDNHKPESAQTDMDLLY